MKVLSLFTGAGGLDIGFEAAGFETVACVDNDPESCKTLRYNRPGWVVHQLDIRQYVPSEEEKRADVVIGGPPCQGFSTAGKGDPDDPRNFLWREYLRIVRDVNPRAVLLENVAGMMLRKNRHHLDGLLRALESLGYRCAFDVLNAADFGVPQVRRRLIVVGLRDDMPNLPLAPAGAPRGTVRHEISDLVGQVRPELNHVPNSHAAPVVERWDRLAYEESDPLYHRSRVHPDKPAPTIRAGGGYGPNGNHLAGFHPPIHYSEPRQLTVREAARLQSFPDEWIFQGSKTAQGRQVGNAVPPRLAQAVARHLHALLIDREIAPCRSEAALARQELY